MNAIRIVLLSFLIGVGFTFLPFDYHWFSYLFEDQNILKSKVTASVRIDGARYYKGLAQNTPNFWNYSVLGAFVALNISLLGSFFRSKNCKPHHLFSLLLSVGSFVFSWILRTPAMDQLKKATGKLPVVQESAALRDIAMSHAVVLVGCLLALALQLSVEDEDTEDERKEKKKKN